MSTWCARCGRPYRACQTCTADILYKKLDIAESELRGALVGAKRLREALDGARSAWARVSAAIRARNPDGPWPLAALTALVPTIHGPSIDDDVETIDTALRGTVTVPKMRRVFVESPYASPTQEGVDRHLAYAQAAMADCLKRSEAPFLSHLLFTQVVDDTKPEERALGMRAGFAFAEVCAATVVYQDLGISPGMKEGIVLAEQADRPIEYRSLPGWGHHDERAK